MAQQYALTPFYKIDARNGEEPLLVSRETRKNKVLGQLNAYYL